MVQAVSAPRKRFADKGFEGKAGAELSAFSWQLASCDSSVTGFFRLTANC